MKGKSPMQSKTLWVNGLVAILAFWDQFMPFLPEKVLGYALPIVGIINIVLRFMTGQPIEVSKELRDQ